VGQDHIDIITFYNEIFIPTVKPLLVELASNGVTLEDNRSTTEDKNNADGMFSLVFSIHTRVLPVTSLLPRFPF